MKMTEDVPLSKPDGYDDMVKSEESEEGEGYPPEDFGPSGIAEVKKRKKKGICHCLKGITCLLLVTVFLFVLSSVIFGYGIAELNAAEFFVPYFDNGNGYNDTVIYKHEGKSKTCHNMNKWFKDCIPMRSETLWNLCVSLFALGGLVGAFAAGPVSNFPLLGRKWTLWISALIFVFSCCLKVVFSNFWALLIGRILHGVASGMATTVVPMYINEITPKSMKGAFGVCNQLGITLGIFISQVISIFVAKTQWWRFLWGWTASLACIQLMTIPFVPHSPKYLVDHNRTEAAKKSLCRLRHSSEEGVKEEFDLLMSGRPQKYKNKDKGSINFENQTKEEKEQQEKDDNASFEMKICSFRTLFHLVIAMMMQVFQQASGINAIMFYSTKVYSTIFPEGDVATILSAITMFINMVSVLPAVFLVEVLGRKWLLMIGTTMEIFCMLGVTVFQVIMTYGFHNDGGGATSFGVLTILSVLLYILFFECSLGPIPWFIVSELFTTNLRSYAAGIACAINWLSTFLVGLIFPYMQDGMNMFCFLVFVFFMVVAWFFILFCVMETKGKEVKQVCEEPYYRTLCFCEVPGWVKKIYRKANGGRNKGKETLITKI